MRIVDNCHWWIYEIALAAHPIVINEECCCAVFVAGTQVDLVADNAACCIYSVLHVLQLQAREKDTACLVWQ